MECVESSMTTIAIAIETNETKTNITTSATTSTNTSAGENDC